MLPVGTKAPARGSKSSAVAVTPPELFPPATSTEPLVSKVAVCDERSADMVPVSAKVPLAASYSSAEEVPAPQQPLLSQIPP